MQSPPDVTCVTARDVTDATWMLIAPRIPVQPSRHRVAVWRELRRLGAVPVTSGLWALPDLPAFADGIITVRELASGFSRISQIRPRGE